MGQFTNGAQPKHRTVSLHLPSEAISMLVFCSPAYSVFTICSNNYYIKQLFCTGPSFRKKKLSRDALGKSNCVPVPLMAVAETPSPVFSTVVCARGVHKLFEMQNYSISHFFCLNATINNMLTLMHLYYWGENTAGKAFKNTSRKACMTFTGLSGINLEKQKDICTYHYISE